ncbi:MAG: DinB family protein [Bacteroidia bacterium]
MTYLKSSIHPLPEYFDRYILECPYDELYEALEKTTDTFRDFNWKKAAELGTTAYAPGKWSIPDIVQHLTDTEWVFNYRALRFARNDQTVLSSYDENEFAIAAEASKRPLHELVEEFLDLRKSTLHLFRSFTAEMLERSGVCWNKRVSVAGLGFISAGHPVHHLKVIEERYFPLIK